ncbi:uncharacterized protein C8R34_12315 [Nitrosomonas sp. Nm84]|uniref:TPM domain-containing protein n=1 Tax=Nitrosomonas sp. Nm84 TaxID=200124 RepID=UPI000D8BA7A5|nr:YgcG family protein [Nitrosomonas sp. Nm84]PXW84926.1 uncharacterized protein C8R34_12315 [Nitrosomonas sp. Nm84]
MLYTPTTDNTMISSGMIPIGIRILALVTLLFTAVCSQAEVAIPPLKSRVTDLTATLSTHEVALLEQKLAAFEKTKGSQIAVLIVPTTQPEAIEQYSIRAVEAWKIGRKKIDDGALLLIAKNDRALRIEVGYGLEGALPDAMAKRIIEEIIVPQFKAGNFADGINAGIDAMLSLIAGESLPPPTRHSAASPDFSSALDHFIPILIALIVLGRLLQTLLGRLAGATVTSIGIGLIGWFMLSSIVAALLVAVFAFLFSLFQQTDGGFYRNGRGNYYRGGNSGNGGFGGGFGGGGGGFGGGGASGRW